MRSAAVISCRRSGPRDTPKADSSGNLRPKLNSRRMEIRPKTWFSPQTVHIRRFSYPPPPCNGTVHSNVSWTVPLFWDRGDASRQRPRRFGLSVKRNGYSPEPETHSAEPDSSKFNLDARNFTDYANFPGTYRRLLANHQKCTANENSSIRAGLPIS